MLSKANQHDGNKADDGGLRASAFAQQRISAWQPVLAPKWMIVALIGVGSAAICLGISYPPPSANSFRHRTHSYKQQRC